MLKQFKYNNSLFSFGLFLLIFGSSTSIAIAQGTRLLRQPNLSETQIVFCHGGDLWISDKSGTNTKRLTSTPAVESSPFFSPDGNWIAFSSNRSGSQSIYLVSKDGGTPSRLTWHPSNSSVRGWTPDGENILYASSRDSAPTRFNRLWTVSKDGGPSNKVTEQWGNNAAYSPDGSKLILDRMSRWDQEWRAYRGGQNTPLIILDLQDFSEILLPHEASTDVNPLWIGNKIYFLSDRDLTSNIWSYDISNKSLEQVSKFNGSDVKTIHANGSTLIYEREGYLNLLNVETKSGEQLEINVVGDFPWAEDKWEDVGENIRSASLSPTGKRAIVETRGEIFTIPVEHGDSRNITLSSGAADRAPLWSPNGDKLAWFSDKEGTGYKLMITNQDGFSEPKSYAIGESKMAWEPSWSPDGKSIAFVDDDTRIQVIDVNTGRIQTADTGGINLERGDMGVVWSPDSQWLAYSKTGDNSFRQIKVWSSKTKEIRNMTNSFANASSPAWDRNGKHLYFMASTDLALGSGWANTSSMTSDPEYSIYLINLRKDDLSPFAPRSDEEEAKEMDANSEKIEDKKKNKKKEKSDEEAPEKPEVEPVQIDFDNLERRTIALPMESAEYWFLISGPAGSVFIAEDKPNNPALILHKFSLEDREAKEFLTGTWRVSVSADGNSMLANVQNSWKVIDTNGPSGKDGKSLNTNIQVYLDREEEWNQIFEEAWRYEKDFFYDPAMHGRDWSKVYDRYSPLIPHVKHRADLSYVLDQVNGELSVGHSFVFGGDFPKVEDAKVGLLGADLVVENGYWKINRIYTTESWNPNLSSPLDRPGIKIKEGDYLLGINGKAIIASDNPYQFLDGTRGKQTTLHVHATPNFASATQETVTPISSENALRQRAWVEDNRKMVDELSGGTLAYVWIPNTSYPGMISFNRYLFAQQDKLGAVIDERFNGGGFLDDYMVDLMTRSLRAALTNEVPGGKPMKLPGGILGPKVLLINELAGSGGDFFPWVFRQQEAGKLIGKRTWGGLVKSSVHYGLVDGGALTAPDNAVFDPINNKWIAENRGIAPDIEVRQTTKALEEGRDPQIERAVEELLKQLKANPPIEVTPPAFPSPAKGN